MLGWIIAIGILLLLFAPRVGLRMAFAPGVGEVWVRFWCFSFCVYPRKKKPKKVTPPMPEEAKKEGKPEKSKKSITEFSLNDARALLPLIQKTLIKLRRAFHIRKLYFHLVCASADVAATAEMYGWSQIVLGWLRPLLDPAVHDMRVSSGWDYDGEKPCVYLLFTASVSPGRLLVIGVGALCRFGLYMFRKKKNETDGAVLAQPAP